MRSGGFSWNFPAKIFRMYVFRAARATVVNGFNAGVYLVPPFNPTPKRCSMDAIALSNRTDTFLAEDNRFYC